MESPRDPNKPYVVELESRILFSANPFFSGGVENDPSQLGQFDCPPHMAQDDWDTFLLDVAPIIKSDELFKIVDEIKAARGLDSTSEANATSIEQTSDNSLEQPDAIEPSNTLDIDAAGTIYASGAIEDIGTIDDWLLTTNHSESLDSQIAQMAKVNSDWVDVPSDQLVIHGTDGTDQLGSSWLTYGNVEVGTVDLTRWGMQINSQGNPIIFGNAAVPEYADREPAILFASFDQVSQEYFERQWMQLFHSSPAFDSDQMNTPKNERDDNSFLNERLNTDPFSTLERTSILYHNLVQDGSFDNSDAPPLLPGFVGYHSGSMLGQWQVESGAVDLNGEHFIPSPSGGRSIELDVGGIPGSILQNIATEPNQIYQVTFSIAGNWLHDSDVNGIHVSAGDQSVDMAIYRSPDANPLAEQWETRSFLFRAVDSQTELKFSAIGDVQVNAAMLSDIHMTALPTEIAVRLATDPELQFNPMTREFSRVDVQEWQLDNSRVASLQRESSQYDIDLQKPFIDSVQQFIAGASVEQLSSTVPSIESAFASSTETPSAPLSFGRGAGGEGQDLATTFTQVDVFTETLSDSSLAVNVLDSVELANTNNAAPEQLGQLFYTEIAFVDSSIDNYQELVASLGANVKVIVLDAAQDGLTQINNALAGRTDLHAIQIFSHGVDGAFQVGSTWINQFTLEWQSDLIAAWGNALADDGDLLIYGCNVASTIDGQAFIDEIASLTHADVAASTNITGHESLGGDWTLEYSTGTIEPDSFVDAADLGDWLDELAISANGTATSAQTTSGTSLTWSHTVNSGYSRALFVTLAIDAVGASVNSVTYGGVALTQVGRTAGNHAVEIWRLLDPMIGTANVVVSLGATTAINGGAVTYNGVNQSTPTGTYASAAGTSTTASVVVTSAANELVLDVTNWDDNPSGYTIGAGQSQNWTETNVSHRGVSTTEAGAASVTMTSSVSVAKQWEIGAISIKEAPNTAPVDVSTATQSIAITNFSFEANTIANGNFTYAPPGWTITGVAGDFNPSTGSFTSGNGTHGSNVGFIVAGGSLNQVLSTNFDSSKNYHLTLDVGRRLEFASDTYTVQLYAGATSIGQFASATGAAGNWSTINVDVVGSNYAAANGGALRITVNDTGANQIAIDNVQLTSTTASATVAENSANGTTVGTVTGLDRDQSGSLSYSLTNSASGRFAIDSSTGVITVANSATLDFETNTSHTITVRVTDAGNLTYDRDMVISLTNVDEATVISAGNASAGTEDTNIVYSSANGNAITISDPDGTTQRVTLSVSNGTLTLSQTTGLTFTAGDGTTDTTMTFSGTIANINAALNGLVYAPTSNYNGSDALRISAIPNTQSSSLDTDASLLVRYTFDNASRLADDIATTADGTVNNATATNDSQRGSVASLSGTGTGVYTDNFSTPASFTAGVWAKSATNTWNNNGMLLSKRDSFILHPNYNTTQITAYISTAGWSALAFDLSTIPGFSLTDWHHYAMSHDGTTLRLYVDGVLRASNAISGTAQADTGAMGIGQDDGLTGRVFSGQLDDARVYSRVLSAGEMSTLAGISSAARDISISIAAVNDAPTSTAAAVSNGGGIQLNTDGGNNAYLVSNSGLTSALSDYTVEVKFAGTNTGADIPLFSYNTAAGDMIRLMVGPSNELQIASTTSGTAVSSVTNYRSLLFDGNTHTVSMTWSNSNGGWAVYVDGVLRDSGTGVATGATVAAGGTFVFGQEQDSQGGGFSSTRYFRGTLYDARLFNTARTASEILASYNSDLPRTETGLVADWRMDDLSDSGVVTESVTGNNLTAMNVTGAGFTASTSTLSLQLDENTVTGTIVGEVHGIDVERQARIASLLAADSTLRYSAETGKFYKLGSVQSTFSAAQSAAIATTLSGIAGQMVTIRSATENSVVTALAATAGTYAWLGASDATVEGTWRWQVGNQANDVFWQGTASGYNRGSYSNWDAAEPSASAANEDFAILSTANGKWLDTTGTNAYVITEWNADTVLDATNSLTYTLLSQTVSGAFSINSSTGIISVADGTKLDYETQTTHTVNVRVTDGSGATYDKALTISLNNLTEDNAAPSDLSSGINLNTDGGNDAYLKTMSGNAIFGGRTALTIEATYTMRNNTASQSPLVSYAASGFSDNEVGLFINPNGVIQFMLKGGADLGPSTPQLIDGKLHTIAISWDNTNGDVNYYIDGQLVKTSTGFQLGQTIGTGGALVLGQDQDTVDGGYNSTQRFSGTYHELRVWDRAISLDQISQNNQQILGSTTTGLIADWRMTGFNGSNQVVDSVGGVNLSIGKATGSGFVSSTPSSNLSVSENATSGTLVGSVVATDAINARDIVSDGLFREASNPGTSTNYTAGQSIGNWTVQSGNVDHVGSALQTSPLGGRSIDLNGTGPGAIAQTITTTAGRQYQVVFNTSGNWSSGEATKDFRVSASGTSQDFSITQPTGWSTSNMLFSGRSMTFTATGSSTTLAFQSLDSGSTGAVIADVRVLEVPAAVSKILSSDTSLSYDAATGKFYKTVSSGATYAAALATSTSSLLNGVSGQLLTIGSSYENDLIWNAIRSTGYNYWIGASDSVTEGTWKWYNGATAGSTFWSGAAAGTLQSGFYANWSSGEPNDSGGSEDNAILQSSSGQWNDVTASSANWYIVEWKASDVLSNYTYTITSDASNAFAINSNTGEITVSNAAPLNEIATDPSVTVQVTDAFGNTYSEAFTIAIARINDNAPIITSNGGGTSAAISIAQNTSAVTTVTATDADLPTPTLTYSIVGGADQAKFTIQSGTGVLTFISAPNPDAPTDVGTDNIYDVVVRASDGTNFDDQSIAVTVININDAPVLADSALTLTVTEDAGMPSGAVGSLVSSFTGAITDPDFGAIKGIAITAINQSNGTWYYTTNSGTTWTAIGAVNSTSSLLLADDANTRLYFNPTADYSGTATSALTFRAWDQTSGTAATKVPTTTNGATTAFSTATDVIDVNVTAVNDAPVLTVFGTTLPLSEDGGAYTALVSSLISVTDADVGSVQGIAIRSLSLAGGTLEYSLDGTTWNTVSGVSTTNALLLRSSDRLRFTPSTTNGGTTLVSYNAWDQTSGSAGGFANVTTTGGTTAFSTAIDTLTVNVASVNDAPVSVLDTATAVEAGGTSNGTAGTNPSGNVLTNDTDVDTGDTKTVIGVTAGVQSSASGNIASSVSGTYGSITIAANGAYTYTVDNNNATVQSLRTSSNTLTDVLTYTMKDSANATSTTQITVTIQGANDTPTITSDGGGSTASISMAENITAVTTVIGNDVDAGTTLSYSIIGGADAAKFSITAGGSLAFVSAPDFEAPTDVGGNNVYDVIVQVSDGSLTTTQAIAVTITDVSNFLVVTTATDNNDSGITTGASYNIEWLNANKGADASVSLREAIIASNNTAGTDTVNFNISGTGVKTISLTSSLPGISEAIVINGYSQTGSSANTLVSGNDAVLNVVLDGTSAGAGVSGLTLASGSSGSTISGLVIQKFNQYGIYVASANNTITGNIIGLNSSGTAKQANDIGVYILNTSGNTIGGTNAADRNVISGNTRGGVYITGASATGNQIQGNFIGLSKSGASALGNGSVYGGVNITSSATGNTIGGTATGAGNVISGNTGASAIDLNAPNNTVQGNIIGLNAAGTAKLANSYGITISSGGTGSIIGGTTSSARNVISGNSSTGIHVVADGNFIRGNYIGTDITGTTALGNTSYGIRLYGSANNTVGGAIAGAGNLISGNGSYGVYIQDANNLIAGNIIGLNAAGTAKLANSYGIYINDLGTNPGGNTIGGTSSLARNVISGNTNDGIAILGTYSTLNVIQGNYVGTNSAGTVSLGNSGSGIRIDTNSNTVGGSAAGAGNVISGNGNSGIYLAGANNTITGNTIGLNAAGTAAVANTHGVYSGGANNTIGGTTASERNVISGNTQYGIYLTSSGLIQGNYIGTNAAGTAAVANQVGISLIGSNVTIGGITAGAGNLISGNTDNGIYIDATDITIQGNYIGTNAAGTGAIANGAVASSTGGIFINEGINVTIGGTATGARNVIAGNGGAGLWIQGTVTNNVSVQNNYIGVDVSGDTALANSNWGIVADGTITNLQIGGTAASAGNVISGNKNSTGGILIATAIGTVIEGNRIGIGATTTTALGTVQNTGILLGSASSGTRIGGTNSASGNIIARNGSSGISIQAGSTGNTIQRNSIFGNTGLGINLIKAGDPVSGITANDGMKTTGEANLLMDTPRISAGNLTGNSLALAGYVGSAANQSSFANARVEFFISDSSSANGSGKTYLGYLTTDASGNFSGTLDVTGLGLTSADDLTATATDTFGNTSEFGVNFNTNGAPTAVADIDTAVEAGGVANGTAGTNPTGSVLTNDTDPNVGDTKTVVGVASGVQGNAGGSVAAAVNGTYGSITIAANGAYTYTVDNNNASVQALRTSSNTLTDVFTYTMQDAGGLTSTTQITITIQGANDTPYDLAATGLTIAENAATGTNVTTITRSDRDTSDTPSYSLVNSAGGRFAIDANTGVISVADSSLLDYEAATSHNLTVRVTDLAGAYYDEVFTINLTDVNEAGIGAISDTNAASNYVLENAANGTVVGVTANAVDPDGTDTVTYSLDDNAGGRFSIDANTGIVTVAGAISREAAPSYDITIRATSTDSSFSTSTMTITIGDVNEFATSAVIDSNATTNSVAENASIGTTVGITASASDADATTNTITYALFDDDGGNFSIDANTGVVTTAVMFNREASGPTRNITVRATSADGSTADTTFTININDLDEFNTSAISDTNASTNTLAENSANGTVVGITAFASDADATTNAITYSLDDDAGGRFTINSSTGVVTVADGSLLDYESAISHNIIVRATSADTSFSTKNFTINITDINEAGVGAISDTNAASNYVLENAANGTVVGVTAHAVDPDGTDTVTYSLDDNAGGRFSIDANTGIVSVAGAINREAAPSYDIMIRATSTDSSFSTSTMTITIGDVNEFATSAVIDSNATTNSVAENASIGTTVGITASASDADATTNTITYALFDDDGGNFSIDANTGVVTTAVMFNREVSGPSRNITIRATSADGSTADTMFTININDLDEFNTSAISDTNASTNTLAENSANGTVVGITAFASDADATTNAITYSLDDDAGGRFTINSSTGVVTVADGSLLDYESVISHNIIVRATSADTSFSTRNFTINITDVNESPLGLLTDADVAANFVLENSSVGTVVGITALSIDPDATDIVTYSLDDDAGGRFAIDANTGVVTVAGAIDREGAASYNITIRASSADASTSTSTMTISIGDVNEFATSAVTDTAPAANSVVENAAIGTTVGITASALDADATTNSITYSMTDSDGGRFAVDATSGVVSVSGTIDRETDGPSRTVTVRATSADGSFSEQTFLINIYDADEFDVGTISELAVGANAVAENSATGTVVNYQAVAIDADATNNLVTYSLDDNAGGRFVIDSSTGIVTVADGSGLNYEANASHTIIVRAMSEDGSWSTTNVTIAVLDVNERPIAFGDLYATSFIDVLRALSNGVLANDSDPDGDTLTMQLISGPSVGFLDYAGNGTFSYTPQSGFVGQVTFVYQAFDGLLASDPIVVTIDVTMPVVGSGGSGGGTGGSSNTDNGSSGSGTGSGSGTTQQTPSDAPPAVMPIGGFIDTVSNVPTPFGGDLPQASSPIQNGVGVQLIGLINSVETHSSGEIAAANSHRTLRSQFEHWASQREISTTTSQDSREQFGLHDMSPSKAEESTEREHSNGALSISIGTAVSTAIGTGAILWVVQATQLAATFISAAAPTWMQVDIASALNSLAKEKSVDDEVSAKLFEK